jgi:hypothetical protein
LLRRILRTHAFTRQPLAPLSNKRLKSRSGRTFRA